MAKNKKVSEYLKENKKEILIGIGVAVTSGLIGVCVGTHKFNKKYPHKTTICSSSKEYIDALREVMEWGSNVKTDGARIFYGTDSIETMKRVTESLTEEGSDKYLYSVILEKIDKTKFR